MFKTDYTFYYGIALRILIIACSSLYLTLACEGFWAHLFGAVLLGAVWQQGAFIAHDLGHNGVTHIQSIDYLLGVFVGNFIGGISVGWWKRSHNTHHIVCNSVEHDPDIQHMPVFAVARDMLKGFFSTYHMK